jgi:hypothetical protein
VRAIDDSEQIYRRQLPGSGFVTIEARRVWTLLGQRRYRGEVRVERREDPNRRSGHVAPVIASAEGAMIGSVLHDLLPVAQSNVAIATRFVAGQHQSRTGRRA